MPLIFRAGAAVARVHATGDEVVLDCPLPWLAGPESQVIAQGAARRGGDDCWLVEGPAMLAGVLVGTPGAALEAETCQLYQRLFAITRGLNCHRLWNYVPQINATVAGVENYLAFNAGRCRAFAQQFGRIAPQNPTAASAVGIRGDTLALAFTAGPASAELYENPLQTPAVRYPERFGNPAPMFARGSSVTAPDGTTCWHLSGTASIRGCETIGGDIDQQLNVTLENIGRMLDEMAVPAQRQAAWKVFLRERRDLEFCRQRLAALYPDDVAQMMFLEADICRRDLLLEIEAVFHQAAPSTQISNKPLP